MSSECAGKLHSLNKLYSKPGLWICNFKIYRLCLGASSLGSEQNHIDGDDAHREARVWPPLGAEIGKLNPLDANSSGSHLLAVVVVLGVLVVLLVLLDDGSRRRRHKHTHFGQPNLPGLRSSTRFGDQFDSSDAHSSSVCWPPLCRKLADQSIISNAKAAASESPGESLGQTAVISGAARCSDRPADPI